VLIRRITTAHLLQVECSPLAAAAAAAAAAETR